MTNDQRRIVSVLPSTVREIAAIAALSLPRWRRDVVLAVVSWLAMMAVLWGPVGH